MESILSPEELAKLLVDEVYPPHWSERRKMQAHKLPLEERYEKVWVEHDIDEAPFATKLMEDGYNSIYAMSFLEITEAFIKALDKQGIKLTNLEK